MTALSLALAYLGTLAFVGWWHWFKADRSDRAEMAELLHRVQDLEAGFKADATLRDTVSSLAIAAGMKPPRL